MKLAPRIIQAMEILQLHVMALQERIQAEMESNPVLELRDLPADEQQLPMEREPEEHRGDRDLVVKQDNSNSEDFERLADYEDEFGQGQLRESAPRASSYEGERDRKLDAMANTPAHEQSLTEYLLGQWAFMETDEAVLLAGRVLITFIEDDGYLKTPLEDLLNGKINPPVRLDQLRQALKLVQTLEPTGVGARDLRECLLIQLAVESLVGTDVSLESELVRNFLREIEMNHLPQIAKRTGKSLAQIKKAIENISRLNPRPGLLIGSRPAPVVLPDVCVYLDDQGHVVVEMPYDNSPHLLISGTYRRLVKDPKAPREARLFIQRNIRSAQWLIGAIEQRRQTVRRVVEEVFTVQRDFLEDGKDVLKPLPMADVARKVGVHVATVSRAVAGKYVQTPRGIFPLRMFFSGGTTTADGQDVAWDAVKAKLKEIIEAEDKTNPLSDDELANQLKIQGLDIARRTIAKYRNLMGIPPARKRKAY